MHEILLTPTLFSSCNLQRPQLLDGCYLGERALACQQIYTYDRLAPLLASNHPGIVRGLEVRTTHIGAVGDGLAVRPGLAVSGDGQLLGLACSQRKMWKSLLEDYLAQTGAASAAGIFYLTLSRSSCALVDDPSTESEWPADIDPTVDVPVLAQGHLGLKRLAMNPSAANANREWVENWVAANQVGLEFWQSWFAAVPLGLLAIEDTGIESESHHAGVYQVKWFSAAVGRYQAIRHSGYRLLLNQTREAFRRLRLAAASQTLISVSDYLAANVKLDFLPAAGELPVELLQNIASHTVAPTLAWLPAHLTVDIVPVPEKSVAGLLDYYLPQRVVDLRQACGEHLRLLLAVDQSDYKCDLLDIPQPDEQLIGDLFRSFMRAYEHWASWQHQFGYLYHVADCAALDESAVRALDLPWPLPCPALPQDFFAQLIQQSPSQVGVDDAGNLRYPYHLGIPSNPLFYQQWSTSPGNFEQSTPVSAPSQNGLVIQYSIAQRELSNIDKQIRELQYCRVKTRDYLLLQRQQLESQAIFLSVFSTTQFYFGGELQGRRQIQQYKLITQGFNELITAAEEIFVNDESENIKTQLLSYGRPQTLEQLEVEVGSINETMAPRLLAAIFSAGKILTSQIAYMETRCHCLEADIEEKLHARNNKEDEIENLLSLIRSGTEQLAALDKRRSECLGDYSVVQHLLIENWLNICRLDQERTRVLTQGVKGLYFIRVCQLPVGLPLVEPLSLHHREPSDSVPGCAANKLPELPVGVEDFFDTVLEIAMDDWVLLRPLKNYIPAADKLDYIDTMRQLRLQTKTAKQVAVTHQYAARGPLTMSMFGIRVQTQSTLHVMAQASMPRAETSGKIYQEQAARVLSVVDVLGSTRGILHKQAQRLHNCLEQAVACLLERLNDLAPSIRLQWAQLAEGDRLPLERVELWPGLERAEREDFMAARTLAEVVSWWFRQLSGDASAAARTAMRNMIRAALIQASLSDSAEMVQGCVQVPPRGLLLGESMRLQLNCAVKAGTLLQLLDTQQKPVALLNVGSHDESGTFAKIIQVTCKDALITTQCKVVASKVTAQFNSQG